MPRTEELAYAAGLFDGEGSICICRNRNRYSLLAQVTNTNPYATELFHELFGGSVSDYYKKLNTKKRIFHWVVQGERAGDFLAIIYPYLRMKRKQAELAFEFLEQRGRGDDRQYQLFMSELNGVRR